MKKKTIALLLVLMMIFGVTCGGTIAYLTATTGPVTNTFTVGNVTITLDEAKVDTYGEKGLRALKNGDKFVDSEGNEVKEPVYVEVTNIADADRVNGNEYKLIPGQTYIKDPTIHVGSTSEDCWLFVKVENNVSDIEDADNTIAKQLETNGWAVHSDNVYYYSKNENTAKAGENIKVFEKFVVADNADLSKVVTEDQIVITAYAVQKDHVDSVAAAWTAVSGS